MTNCTHSWQQIGVDLFRPSLKVRCVRCLALGEVLKPTSLEITRAFYASPQTPIAFEDFPRVSSAGVETLSWAGD